MKGAVFGIFEFMKKIPACNDRQQFEATACLLAASHRVWTYMDMEGYFGMGEILDVFVLGSGMDSIVKNDYSDYGDCKDIFSFSVFDGFEELPLFNLFQDQVGRIPSSWRQRSKAFRHAIREARLASTLECLSLASKGFRLRTG